MSKKLKHTKWDFSNLPPEKIPIKQGRYFCSPSCGRGCQRVHFERAVKAAKSLARKLGGKPWIANVWEQSGWGFQAQAENVAIYGRYQQGTRTPKVFFKCVISGFCAPSLDDQWYPTVEKAIDAMINFFTNKAGHDVTRLFLAAKTLGHKGEFFRIFTQLDAVEFLRFPNGRPSMSPNP